MVADVNGDHRQDIVTIVDDPFESTRYKVWLAEDPGKHIVGSGKADGLLGDKSKETIAGLAGKDVIFAAGGKDKANGCTGNDYINGGSGGDKLLGSSGKDALVGGLDADKLGGGGGRDKFQFNATLESSVAHPDTILDFHKYKVDLHNIDADTATTGNQAFAFIGGDTFASHAGTAGLL